VVLLKNKVVADTSFFCCYAYNLKRSDWLLHYLDLYEFHYGPNIKRELSSLHDHKDLIYDKLVYENHDYNELFKALSDRDDKHIEEDGEYDAIGIAITLSLTNSLKYLVLDDKGPKNFAKFQIAALFKELDGKICGTVGFINNSHCTDALIQRDHCVEILKTIYQTHCEYEMRGDPKRPCSMDSRFVKNELIPLISKLEEKL